MPRLVHPHIVVFCSGDEFFIGNVDEPGARPIGSPAPLAALLDGGFDQAAHGLGAAIISIMAAMYPESFAKYPDLVASANAASAPDMDDLT